VLAYTNTATMQAFQQSCGPDSAVAYDFVKQLLKWDPTERLGNITDGAAAVKAHPFLNGVELSRLCLEDRDM
jgi:hypothetical protein